MKKVLLNAIIVILVIASVGCFIYGRNQIFEYGDNNVNDNTKLGNVDTIILSDSKAKVSFSDVILSKHKETRKLIVSEQTATISADISSQVIDKVDWDFLKKTQSVSYTGTGYFVVDLDKIQAGDLIDDSENMLLTIRINHSYLETITIDPEQIKIGNTKNGLLAQGKLKLTVNDFNQIEKEIQKKLIDKFNTASNGQEADSIALDMVREIYEPVVKAVNSDYKVVVEFK